MATLLPRSILRVCWLLPLSACFLPTVQGQNYSAAVPSPVIPDVVPVLGDSPATTVMAKRMVAERNTLRQKQIIDDTNRLLELSKQLKDAVDKTTKNELSLNVVNTANEIEKLAKSVKEKMRAEDGTPVN